MNIWQHEKIIARLPTMKNKQLAEAHTLAQEVLASYEKTSIYDPISGEKQRAWVKNLIAKIEEEKKRR